MADPGPPEIDLTDYTPEEGHHVRRMLACLAAAVPIVVVLVAFFMFMAWH